MIAELGHLALCLGAAMALLQLSASLGGLTTGRQDLVFAAKAGVLFHFLLLLLSFAALVRAFLLADFSMGLVLGQIRTIYPSQERLVALITSPGGVALLALIILAGFGAWGAFSKEVTDEPRVRLLAIFGSISLAGVLVLLLGSSPLFVRTLPAPTEGQGVNILVNAPMVLTATPLLLFGVVAVMAGCALCVVVGRKHAPNLLRLWFTIGWAALTFWGAWWLITLPDPLFMGQWWSGTLAIGFLWVVTTILLLRLAGKLQLRRRLDFFRSTRRFTAQGVGLALIAFGMFLAGIGGLAAVFTEQQAKPLYVGDSLTLGHWHARLADVRPQAGPDWTAVEGQVQLMRAGHVVAVLKPQLRTYIGHTEENVRPIAGKGRWWLSNAHANFGDPDSAGRWPVTFGIMPFGSLIPFGLLLAGAGALFSLGGPRRLRLPRWKWVQRHVLRQEGWQ